MSDNKIFSQEAYVYDGMLIYYYKAIADKSEYDFFKSLGSTFNKQFQSLNY